MLDSWCEDNKIVLEKIEDNLFLFKGELFLLLNSEEKTIEFYEEEMVLSITKKEIEYILELDVKYALYEFGNNYYYTKISERFKDNHTITPDFTDFLYLGDSSGEEFCHLGVHGGYELLNGCTDYSVYAKKAKFLGHSSIGICEKNTLAGTLSFQDYCTKNGIKSIIGETITILYEVDGGLDEKHEGKLYVKNYTGWRNLLRINKIINVDNQGEFIEEKELMKYGEGLIFIFSVKSIVNNRNILSEIKDLFNDYEDCFDDVYYQFDVCEYEDDIADINKLNHQKYMIDQFRGEIKFVLINDSYYVEKQHYKTKTYLNLSQRINEIKSRDQHYKSLFECKERLQDMFSSSSVFTDFWKEIISNSINISNSCNFMIETGNHKLPKFVLNTLHEFDGNRSKRDKADNDFKLKYNIDPKDNIAIFKGMLSIGFEQKLIWIEDEDKMIEYYKRMELESEVIINAGFVDYFLILWDIIKWAKSNDILVGVGRGSVGGSLASYLLDITDIDPIKFDLMFERFINEARSTPEIRKKMTLEDGRVFSIPVEFYDVLLVKNSDISEEYIKQNLSQYQL